MIRADEIHEVLPGLFFWQVYDPAVKADLCSTAIVLDGKKLILFDPVSVDWTQFEEISSRSKLAAVVLTNGNHERAAAEFRARFKVPVIAHADCATQLSLEVDQVAREGEKLFGQLEVIELKGFALGEIALHWAKGGVVFMGDALINLDSHGFGPLPAKYCSAPKQTRRSLQKLLHFSYEVMTFAHGLPIIRGARQRLGDILK